MFVDKFRNQQTVCYVWTGCGKSYRPKLDFQIRKDENLNVYLDFEPSFACSCCNSMVIGTFKSQPICVIVEPFYKTSCMQDEFNLVDLPLLIEVCNKKFSFICCTIGNGVHFKAVFC